MNRARIFPTFAVAAAIALIGACGGDGDGGPNGTTPPPVAGTLSVVLDAADNNAAAIHFSISGSQITNVRAGTGITLHQRSSGNSVNMAVLGTIGDGSTLVTFDVPDVSGSYTVNLVDVADNSNALLNKGDYSLSIQS